MHRNVIPSAIPLVILSAAKDLALALAVLASVAGTTTAQTPLGNAFSYQGRLTDGGSPANGSYDLQFELFDAATGGSSAGGPIELDGVTVSAGLFTVSVDFGPSAFAGQARWLEIGVKPAGAPPPFTVLGTRQELTPSPNAVYSSTAPWTGIAGKPPGFDDDIDNDVLGGLACANGQVPKWNGATWACAADADSGGDITAVTAGTALTGGGTSGTVTLAVDLGGSGSATTVSRTDHHHLGQAWTGAGVGLRVESTDTDGLEGVSSATSGGSGVRGETSSSSGTGVFGLASATSGFANGIWGRTYSADGNGVVGQAMSSTGFAWGVVGSSPSTQGVGVYGASTPTSGTGVGVSGYGASPNGYGGYFENASGGPALGVSAGGIRFADSTTQTTAAADPAADITGVSAGTGLTGGGTAGDVTLNVDLAGSGAATTVARSDHDHFLQIWNGNAPNAPGLRVINSSGPSGFTDGVWGQSNAAGGARGVVGYAPATSGTNYGVLGQSNSVNGRGVYGFAASAAGGTGVYGLAAGTAAGTGVSGEAANVGVWGRATNSDSGYGVVGEVLNTAGTNFGVFGFQSASPAGYAGYFQGRVAVTGTLSKGAGSFKIDHPLDPENKYLYHSFVESPDMMNIYNGMVTTGADGLAAVELPGWFEALNRDFRYQLTVIGDGDWARARVFRKIADGRFVIQTDVPSTEVSWQVTGIRQDPFAEKNRIPVEEVKPADERGTYLHPEAWGQAKEAGLDYKRRAQVRGTSNEP